MLLSFITLQLNICYDIPGFEPEHTTAWTKEILS